MTIDNFIEKFKDQLEDTSLEITPETNYSNAEYWDSLTAMVMKVMLEDDFGIDIQPEKITAFNSVQELYDFVVENSK